ncbi:hypothetical protein [Pseudoclavibacter sp. RFBB5]|nr:hypothetical protein [Pseudoclavibacter sp. RFBB5]
MNFEWLIFSILAALLLRSVVRTVCLTVERIGIARSTGRAPEGGLDE